MNIFHIDVMDGGKLIPVAVSTDDEYLRLLSFVRDAKDLIEKDSARKAQEAERFFLRANK